MTLMKTNTFHALYRQMDNQRFRLSQIAYDHRGHCIQAREQAEYVGAILYGQMSLVSKLAYGELGEDRAVAVKHLQVVLRNEAADAYRDAICLPDQPCEDEAV